MPLCGSVPAYDESIPTRHQELAMRVNGKVFGIFCLGHSPGSSNTVNIFKTLGNME